MSFEKSEFFSVQNISTISAMIFIAGVSYATLTAADSAQEQATVALQVKTAAMTKDVQDIKIDVATIKTNQGNQSEQVQQLREEIKGMRSDMQLLIRAVRN